MSLLPPNLTHTRANKHTNTNMLILSNTDIKSLRRYGATEAHLLLLAVDMSKAHILARSDTFTHPVWRSHVLRFAPWCFPRRHRKTKLSLTRLLTMDNKEERTLWPAVANKMYLFCMLEFQSLIWCSFVSSLILHQKIYSNSQLMPEDMLFFFFKF